MQWYLISTCTALWCRRARSPFEVDYLLHCLQGYLIPSCTAFWCRARCPFQVNSLLHCLQRYLTHSCTALWCWARFLLSVNPLLHCLKGCLTSSCTFLISKSKQGPSHLFAEKTWKPITDIYILYLKSKLLNSFNEFWFLLCQCGMQTWKPIRNACC